jgi:hypothetical protein
MAILDAKDSIELAMTYRRVFNTPDGRIVLEDMLSDLKLHDTVDSQHDSTLQNYAKLILFKMGVLQDFNMVRIIDSYFKMPISPGAGDGQ